MTYNYNYSILSPDYGVINLFLVINTTNATNAYFFKAVSEL